jgi:hypothetical protein
LIGAGSTINGAADTATGRISDGQLIGSGSTVFGDALRFKEHQSSGSLTGFGSVITGQSLKTSIFITDFHDGDYRKKKIKGERNAEIRRRKQIEEAYEILVEGRPTVAAAIVKPYIGNTIQKTANPPIDFGAFMADLERVEWLLNEYIELDDEEVLTLL